jgi:HAE1 family hydrophobic/amphiphilic exporter-1
MQLTRLAVTRPLTILMALLALVIMGAVGYTYLKIDRLPPISIPFVSVQVAYTGATAQDIEQLVTEPIENVVAGMPGAVSVTSTSSEGSASINVQLADGTDASAAALEVERRVAGIRNRLPADAGDPRVNKADPNSQPIMNVGITGGSLDDLYRVANDQFVPALQSVPGVASVNISGGLATEIQVKLDYAKLAAYGVTPAQISTALTNANVNAPVGSLDQGATTLNVRSLGAFRSIQDLSDVVITQTTGGPILLRDLATVQQGTKTQTQLQRLNGTDAVGLSIVKQSDANALQVADGARVTLAKLQGLLPPESKVVITNDTSVFTRASLDAIQHDLVLSVLVVAGVLLLFLHAWRHTVIVLLAIPTSLVSTFLVMYILGFSLNIMSLMALALMVGILVDDSIVVIENIHRHLDMGESPFSAALTGRSEIGLAAIAITLADVVVYTPIAFISGTLGQLFRQYGLTIVAATLFSLLIGFTLTPMLASRWLHAEDKTGNSPMQRFGRWWDYHFERLARGVASMVPLAIKMRWLVLGLSTALVIGVGSLVPLGVIGTEYAPQEDDNNFSMSMQTPPGTSLSRTNEAALQLEGIIRAVPEVQYVFTSVSGGGGGGFGPSRGGGRASFAVQLVPEAQRDRSVFQIMDQLRAAGRNIPGITVNADVSSPLGGAGGFGGGGLTSINLQLAGPELNTLNQVGDEVLATMLTIPGITDARNSSAAGTPELHIQLDRQRMAQLNVTSQAVATALRTAISGSQPTVLRADGADQQDITLVAADNQRYDLSSLASIPVGTGVAAGAAGAAANTATTTTSTAPSIVTLGQVATIGYGTGPVSIQRVDRNRTMTITGTASGRPLGDVAKDVTAAVKNIQMPAGYSFQVRGGVQQLNNSFLILGQALILSVILEYMLLVALYESFFYPIVLILGVPLGVVGSLLALYVTHNTLNIFSVIGLIMAVGLVAKNGILLVDFTNTLRKRGMARGDALRESVRVRLRPILMTTCTMSLGMLPLAMKLEPGAESRAPMAVVVIGGLLSSTLLAILVTPALYTFLDDLQDLVLKRRRPVVIPRERVTVETPVPAPVPVGAAASAVPSGSAEPAWLQRLRAGSFDD